MHRLIFLMSRPLVCPCQYFAFLHEYATWLLLPAVLGVAVQEPSRMTLLSELCRFDRTIENGSPSAGSLKPWARRARRSAGLVQLTSTAAWMKFARLSIIHGFSAGLMVGEASLLSSFQSLVTSRSEKHGKGRGLHNFCASELQVAEPGPWEQKVSSQGSRSSGSAQRSPGATSPRPSWSLCLPEA